MKNFKKLYFLFMILILLISCSESKKGVNCIVLLDYSASLPNEEFDKYVDMFRSGLLKQMTFNDRIVLIPIDKASEMRNEIIGECRFDELKNQLSQNIQPFQVLSEADTVLARFHRTLDTLFQRDIYYFRDQRKSYNLETDIIGALNQAASYLNHSKTAIFIFSDMIQESPEVNLKRLKDKTSLDKKLNYLVKTAQIPDLKNASIFVCGATEASKQNYRLNKYFWTIFFEKANSTLQDYGYGNSDRIANFLIKLRN